jgi:hypothetical protein
LSATDQNDKSPLEVRLSKIENSSIPFFDATRDTNFPAKKNRKTQSVITDESKGFGTGSNNTEHIAVTMGLVQTVRIAKQPDVTGRRINYKNWRGRVAMKMEGRSYRHFDEVEEVVQRPRDLWQPEESKKTRRWTSDTWRNRIGHKMGGDDEAYEQIDRHQGTVKGKKGENVNHESRPMLNNIESRLEPEGENKLKDRVQLLGPFQL